MQSNVDCIMDELNEFPDSWVELYNPGDLPVSLGGYQIGLSYDVSSAWQLPDTTIGAKKYIIVMCDKVAEGLHTDFRLETAKGGSLFLFHDSVAVDSLVDMAKQPAPNVAYGREYDASDKWGYQYEATPGFSNCGKIVSKLLGQPIFSQTGIVFQNTCKFNLVLSMPAETPDSAVIRYTVDGSEPTGNSRIYQDSIVIDSTTVVRAKLFCNGCISPRSTAQSYIFLNRKQTLPVISLVTDSRYLWDDTLGIYVKGAYNEGANNYDFDWRRPVNVEMFSGGDSESVINQLCEMRVHGGATRVFPLKSLNIYAHKRFGKKRLKYEFFPEQKPGLDDFKSIILRNAGNDYPFLYLRDALIQTTMASHTDIDWQAYQPAVVYINGQYMGILNIRERSNEDYIYTNYGGMEDIDLIKDLVEVKKGDMKKYMEFRDFYSEVGHTYEEYDKWMDCEEFINYMIMNLFFNNQDFPGNNFVMWRPRKDDAKFRFIALDTDFGMGFQNYPAEYETLKWFYNPGYDSLRNWGNIEMYTRLFRHAMEDSIFRNSFIDKASVYMGDFLNYKGVHEIWDRMYANIKEELPYHIGAQTIPYEYEKEMTMADEWIAARPSVFYKEIADFYGLALPAKLKVNISPIANDSIRLVFNGISLSHSSFDGMYYPGRKVHISISNDSSGELLGWRIGLTYNGVTVYSELPTTDKLDFQMPLCQELRIEPLFSQKIKPGDLNCDGKVNVNDVVLLIDEILNKPGKQYVINRDLNYDNEVNVLDVMALIDLILDNM